MAAQFHYLREGQQYGPVSAEQLKQAAASGGLRPHDLVWSEGFTGWVQATKVKGLFPVPLAPAPPPPLPPPLTKPATKPSQRTPDAPAALPQHSNSLRWVIVAGVGVFSLVVVGSMVGLVVALTWPRVNNRQADKGGAKDSLSTDKEKDAGKTNPKGDSGTKTPTTPKEAEKGNPKASTAGARHRASGRRRRRSPRRQGAGQTKDGGRPRRIREVAEAERLRG
jgi:hypothetical protein